jgi:translation elongation factor EF-G
LEYALIYPKELRGASRRFATSSKNSSKDKIQLPKEISIIDEDAAKIIQQIPLEDVRNFCLVAHIDHGKSSLSSRILELAGNLGPEAQKIAQAAANGILANNPPAAGKESTSTSSSQKEQYELFDTLSVEQQRGITIKASTATMLYRMYKQ